MAAESIAGVIPEPEGCGEEILAVAGAAGVETLASDADAFPRNNSFCTLMSVSAN